MEYELAKELKDSGFPLKGYCVENECHCGYEHRMPTLSELIESCPKKIDAWDEYKAVFTLRFYDEGDWTAGYWFLDDWTKLESGSTPEEAVAMLYLSLYGKKQNSKDAGETPRVEGK